MQIIRTIRNCLNINNNRCLGRINTNHPRKKYVPNADATHRNQNRPTSIRARISSSHNNANDLQNRANHPHNAIRSKNGAQVQSY